MDFDLTEEQRAFQATARQFARDEMMPHARDWDENETFPVEALRQAAALGFGGIYVKEDVGGSALSRLDAALIFEELAQGCTSTAAYISIHNMAAWMIDAFGGDAVRKKFLPKLCTMEHFAELLPDRAGRGLGCRQPHDARAPRRRALRARRHQGLHLRRRRLRHLCGDGAHRRSRPARHFDHRGGEGHAGTFLRRAGKEARLEVAADRDGDVRELPRAGGKSDRRAKAKASRSPWPGSTAAGLNIGACSIGGAQFCLDRTIDYMKERKQFGSRLADFQALQFRIADYATELDAARLLLHRAAVAVSAGEPAATRLAAQAKRLATDTGFEVVNGCLQLHGGYGYLRDHPIERVLRDVRVHQILEGTNEIMRLIVSRAMLGN